MNNNYLIKLKINQYLNQKKIKNYQLQLQILYQK